MAEHAADDATKLGPSSISSCLPLLVFKHRHPGQEDEDVDNEMLMFSISKQSLHKNMEQGLLAAGDSSMFWTTPQGWILLIRARDDPDAAVSACLWNPSTGDKLPLPDVITEFPYHNRCILSHKDPTHPGCVVVLFSSGTPDFWYCHTTTGDDSSSSNWRYCSYNIGNCASVPKPPKERKARRPIRPIKKIIFDMASFRGKIYFSNWPKDMRAIDFSSCTSMADHNDRPKFQKFNIPLVGLPEGLSSGRRWLVESQDQLFVVTIGWVDFNPDNIGAIEVHKMDCSSTQDCWRRVHDIGDAVFLLEDANLAASCTASTLGLKANQIFFMKNFMDDDGDLCIFYLETNSQEITRVHNHEDLILCRKPFWIVPPS